MNYYLLGGLLLLISSCQTKTGPFPSVMDINEFPTTTMVATMEEEVDWNKNVLYCPTLLYAWQEIKDTLPQPFVIEAQLLPLRQLNNSVGHLGALEEGEYEKEITVELDHIAARASFKANLLLETPLESNPIPLSFDGEKVASFGGYGINKAVANQVEVLFYESAEELAILLFPKDRDQHLILYKTRDKTHRSLGERYAVLLEKMEHYESNGPKASTWVEDDVLAIPTLAFNLEKNYERLEGSSFSAGGKLLSIMTAQQRIALALNETGALVESEAEVILSRSAEEELQSRLPLRLIFNDDFLLVAKKRTAVQPYLLTWISDPTLMTPIAE
ncbi:MAG: hypothetical protein ACRBFS_19755 [Aureispira sp.]